MLEYRTTCGFIVVAVILIVVFDIIALMLWGENGSLSRVMLAIARQWPIAPFALGVIVGHIFWPN